LSTRPHDFLHSRTFHLAPPPATAGFQVGRASPLA